MISKGKHKYTCWQIVVIFWHIESENRRDILTVTYKDSFSSKSWRFGVSLLPLSKDIAMQRGPAFTFFFGSRESNSFSFCFTYWCRFKLFFFWFLSKDSHTTFETFSKCSQLLDYSTEHKLREFISRQWQNADQLRLNIPWRKEAVHPPPPTDGNNHQPWFKVFICYSMVYT